MALIASPTQVSWHSPGAAEEEKCCCCPCPCSGETECAAEYSVALSSPDPDGPSSITVYRTGPCSWYGEVWTGGVAENGEVARHYYAQIDYGIRTACFPNSCRFVVTYVVLVYYDYAPDVPQTLQGGGWVPTDDPAPTSPPATYTLCIELSDGSGDLIEGTTLTVS